MKDRGLTKGILPGRKPHPPVILDLHRPPSLALLPDPGAVSQASAEIRAELRDQNERMTGLDPHSSNRTKRKARHAAGIAFAKTVYGSPAGPRKLAEAVIHKKFGKHSEWIYLIGSGVDGPIKIGYARNPRFRLSELQVGNPVQLYLLAAFRGGPDVELMLHAVFDEDRMAGEWFKRSDVLVEFIAQVTKPEALYPDG